MKKKQILIIVLLVLFAVLQTSFFPRMLLLNTMPDIVLLFVCLMSYFRGSREGMVYGIAGGLALDFMIGSSIGFFGLIYMLAGLLTGIFPRKSIWDNMFITMGITIGVVFSFEMVIYWLKKFAQFFSLGMENFSFETGAALTKLILPGILYDCIVFIPVYLICRKLEKFLDRDKKLMAGF